MVEFNTDVLDASDRKNVDLKRFSSDNYVVPGNYLLDIRVNGWIGPYISIHFLSLNP
ncbi:FimD/PapC N-terminal domain-containing protein [Hafnia paralvei]|uniref:FimD/PapC N-terminal domain-containing protein n=1 Tax=Hafnia paralvei TaxID=546367 RepID=UPI0023B7A42D|nr:FimD/PapC N-terminal domain-containing protein [Hafnia paralvei]